MNQHRRSAIELLSLLGSHEAQLEYARAVAIADVPAELVCMWFDDFWSAMTPSDEYSREFSRAERQALEQFTAAYQAEISALPMHIDALGESDAWQRVRAAARRALDALAPTDRAGAG